MNELTVLLEKLASTMGTNVEILWGALLTQAPISATVSLIGCITIIVCYLFAFRFVRKKTTLLEGENYPEWDRDEKIPAYGALLFTGIVITIIVLISLENIISGYFNPEYWALKEILTGIKW